MRGGGPNYMWIIKGALLYFNDSCTNSFTSYTHHPDPNSLLSLVITVNWLKIVFEQESSSYNIFWLCDITFNMWRRGEFYTPVVYHCHGIIRYHKWWMYIHIVIFIYDEITHNIWNITVYPWYFNTHPECQIISSRRELYLTGYSVTERSQTSII